MSPLLALRASLLSLCWLAAACSTPISPYSPLEDEDEGQDELPARDAGSDAARDAGARDAGTRDADTGGSANCVRIPSADRFGSLLDEDCASRTAQACAPPGESTQAAINQRLASTVTRCGGPTNLAFGVSFGPSGCPAFYGFSGANLAARISQCIQIDLETWRLACTPSCAVIGAFAR